jgi:hypothetical protein
MEIIYVLFDVLKNLVSNYEKILSYQKENYDPILAFTDPINPIPLLKMNRIKVENEIKENLEVDIIIYDTFKKAIYEFLRQEKKDDILNFIRNRLSNSKQSSIVFKRLLLSIYEFAPAYFMEEIKQSLIKYLGNDDIYHEYSKLVHNTLPIIDSDVRTTYINEVIDWVEKLNLDLETNLKDVHTYFRFFQPIEDYLPPEKKIVYEGLTSKYPRIRPDGFLAKISVWHEQTSIEEISYSELRQILMQHKLEGYQYYLVEYNLDLHAIEFVKNIGDVDNINESFYPTLLESVLSKNKEGKINTEDILPLVNRIVCIDKSRSNKLLLEISEFIHKCLNDNISYEDNKDTILSIIKYLLNITSNIKIKSDSFTNKTLFEKVRDSHVFYARAALIKYNFWMNKNTSSYGMMTEVSNLENIHRDQHNSIFNLAAYAAYFSTLTLIDEAFVSKNINTILPDLDSKNKVHYYTAWLFFLNENAVNTLVNKHFQKLLNYFNSIKLLRLERSDPLRILSINAIMYPLLYDKDINDSLFDAFIIASTSEIRTKFLVQLVRILKKGKQENSQNSSVVKVLRKVISNNSFKGNSELLDVFLNSPFEKNYSLDFINEYLTRPDFDVKADHWILDDVILELSNYHDINESQVLSLISMILKKLTEAGIFVNYEKVYSSLEKMQKNITNKDQFNRIIEYILKTSYEIKFSQLKV